MPTIEAHPLTVRERDVPDPRGTFVLLHGRGTDEHDLFGLFDVLDPQRTLRGITVGAPLRLPPGGKHWYVVPRVGFPDAATFHHSLAALDELLGDLDWSTTLVGGFSQGAVMAFALGLGAGRPVPAGIVAFSGFVPVVEGWTPDLASRPGLPVLLAHGTRDPVISVEFARQAKGLLEAGGAALEYHETPMPHTIDPRVLPQAQAFVARSGA
ncbi:MAG TPA: phospholipase [Baekduia sp.]|nr:phospholipase [Baekduia sp.]